MITSSCSGRRRFQSKNGDAFFFLFVVVVIFIVGPSKDACGIADKFVVPVFVVAIITGAFFFFLVVVIVVVVVAIVTVGPSKDSWLRERTVDPLGCCSSQMAIASMLTCRSAYSSIKRIVRDKEKERIS